MSLQDTFLLNSGYQIPKVGLGTYELLGSKGEIAINNALALGYRHLDTAQMYGNEDLIGRCIQQYDRNTLFLTSKIGPWQYGHSETLQAAEDILKNLNTDYVDLLLLHWPGVYGLSNSDPQQVEKRHESYRALELLKDQGKVRSIGISNFLDFQLDKLLEFCSVKPSVNQIEFHPLCHDDSLGQRCQDEGIVVEAYCPLARIHKKLWKSPIVEGVARETGRTIAQVVIKWGLCKGVVVLPKTQHMERLRENIDLDFALSENQVQQIDSLHENIRVDWDPYVITV